VSINPFLFRYSGIVRPYNSAVKLAQLKRDPHSIFHRKTAEFNDERNELKLYGDSPLAESPPPVQTQILDATEISNVLEKLVAKVVELAAVPVAVEPVEYIIDVLARECGESF
jgi:hypothetical protein